MTLPTEINAARYYELEIKARGYDIFQELEVITERIKQLQIEKQKVLSELENVYKMQQNESNEFK